MYKGFQMSKSFSIDNSVAIVAILICIDRDEDIRIELYRKQIQFSSTEYRIPNSLVKDMASDRFSKIENRIKNRWLEDYKK